MTNTRREAEEAREKLSYIKRVISIGVTTFVSVLTFWMSIFVIAQYERGIITRLGAINRIAEPGFGVQIPFIDSLERINMRIRSFRFENMESYSSDQQLAKLDVSVTLMPRVSKLEKLYTEFRTVEGAIDAILKPFLYKDTKVIFGRYTATSAIKEREKLNIDVKEELISSLGENSVLEIISVNIEDVEFSSAYVKSVEDRMMAEVEVLKVKQNWEKEKVTADIIRTQAEAEAFRIKAKGDAEAAAIAAKTKALTDNPRYIEMLQAEKWDGKLPTTVLPTTAIPLINQRQ